MRGAFEFDVLACPRCGGRLRLIALIEEAAVIGRMLRHLGLLTACRSPGPPVRHRSSPRRARRRPTSTNRLPERRLLAVDMPEVYPRRPGVLDGRPRRLDTAAAGAIIGAPRGSASQAVLIRAVWRGWGLRTGLGASRPR